MVIRKTVVSWISVRYFMRSFLLDVSVTLVKLFRVSTKNSVLLVGAPKPETFQRSNMNFFISIVILVLLALNAIKLVFNKPIDQIESWQTLEPKCFQGWIWGWSRILNQDFETGRVYSGCNTEAVWKNESWNEFGDSGFCPIQIANIIDKISKYLKRNCIRFFHVFFAFSWVLNLMRIFSSSQIQDVAIIAIHHSDGVQHGKKISIQILFGEFRHKPQKLFHFRLIRFDSVFWIIKILQYFVSKDLEPQLEAFWNNLLRIKVFLIKVQEFCKFKKKINF